LIDCAAQGCPPHPLVPLTLHLLLCLCLCTCVCVCACPALPPSVCPPCRIIPRWCLPCPLRYSLPWPLRAAHTPAPCTSSRPLPATRGVAPPCNSTPPWCLHTWRSTHSCSASCRGHTPAVGRSGQAGGRSRMQADGQAGAGWMPSRHSRLAAGSSHILAANEWGRQRLLAACCCHLAGGLDSTCLAIAPGLGVALPFKQLAGLFALGLAPAVAIPRVKACMRGSCCRRAGRQAGRQALAGCRKLEPMSSACPRQSVPPERSIFGKEQPQRSVSRCSDFNVTAARACRACKHALGMPALPAAAAAAAIHLAQARGRTCSGTMPHCPWRQRAGGWPTPE